MPDALYHIVSPEDWRRFSDGREYRPESLQREGFIHFSSREQLLGTANTFFKGRLGLLVLELKLPPCDGNLKWETAAGPGGKEDLFPHYYSSLSLDAVRRIFLLEPSAEGGFAFPEKTLARPRT